MFIKSLKLKNYRNYDSLNLTFDEKTNILYGNNAQGKTNILEALYLCGTTKSHRSAKDQDLINFNSDDAHIEVVFDKAEIEYKIDFHLKKFAAKGIAINKVPIKRASDLFGHIHFVFFSPEDLTIIKDGPSARRKFIDFELSQLDKIYLNDLSKYDKIVKQRNSLLKDIGYQNNQQEMLDIWDEKLIEYGNKIISSRHDFISKINRIVSEIHRKITNGIEELEIIYEKSNGDNSLEEEIKKNRNKDLRLKTTTVGPHRDDIIIKANNIDLRKYGSQGQQRTAALSLKLSEIDLVQKQIDDTPILLLDDVLSELDKNRQHFLLESIRHIQTLITCTGLDEFVNHRFSINKLFYVENGTVITEN